MRTASGALMNALRNDIDLQTFSEMVDTVKNHASALGKKHIVSGLSQFPSAS